MITNYEDIKDNIKSGNYKLIGEGSGRSVFDMQNGYVIKVGRNRKGLAQNRQENEIYLAVHSRVLAPVLDISYDNKILIMERAERYSSSNQVCQFYGLRHMKDILSISDIRFLYKEYNLVSADLVRLSSWGKIGGRPVLVDYGFTYEIRHKYYE